MKLRLAWLLTLMCGGCQLINFSREEPLHAAVQEPIQDPVTREVFTPLLPALTFVHKEPRLSANGRDFLHVVPIQTSQNGYRVVYLWVGRSSSIDRGVANILSVDDDGGSAALMLNLASADGEAADEVVLPLVTWEGGRLLEPMAGMPVTTHERTALGAGTLRELVNTNPRRIVLVDGWGRHLEFEHQSGDW